MGVECEGGHGTDAANSCHISTMETASQSYYCNSIRKGFKVFAEETTAAALPRQMEWLLTDGMNS